MAINKAINSRFFLGTIVLLCFWLSFGAGALAKTVFEKTASTTNSPKVLRVLEFKIQKLSCATCAKEMVNELIKFPGITYARIEMDLPWDANSLVVYNSKKLKKQAVLDQIHKHMYYEAEVKDRPCKSTDLNCLLKPVTKPLGAN